MLVACSGGDMMESQDADTDSGNNNGADAAAMDSASDAASDGKGAYDAQPPKAPSCPAGDRQEFAGTIPNTLIVVAVCSTCGESYVIAASGSENAADVTIDNGAKTITTNIPALGTATSAKLADAADSTIKVCGTSGTQGCLPTAPPNQEYCDPYRDVKGLRPERIDQGVDYGGAGPIYAMGPGTIDLYYNRSDTGWPGNTFVSYKLSAGPASGKVIYLAENIDLNPALKKGSFVYSGTVLGTLVNAYPDSESGWGVQGAGYTAEHSCYTEGCMTALGQNFNDLLVCLKTPSGTKGVSGCCTSSAGYPANWCTLLSMWQ
jgi:hypothetical protein